MPLETRDGRTIYLTKKVDGYYVRLIFHPTNFTKEIYSLIPNNYDDGIEIIYSSIIYITSDSKEYKIWNKLWKGRSVNHKNLDFDLPNNICV